MNCSDTHEPCREPPPRRPARLWLEALTLTAVSAYLLFSYFSGRAGSFVAPAYVWMAPAAAALILAMAVARIAAARGSGACGCEEEEYRGRIPLWACSAAILASVALAVVVDPQAYSMEQMRKRRAPVLARDVEMKTPVAGIVGRKPGADDGAAARSLSKNPTVLDLIRLATIADRSTLEGQYVTVIGQCDLRDGPAAPRFDLYRLVVTCCVADGQAVAVEVVRTSSESLDDRAWVSVGGILRFDSQVAPSMPVIHAATISKIPPPRAPYL